MLIGRGDEGKVDTIPECEREIGTVSNGLALCHRGEVPGVRVEINGVTREALNIGVGVSVDAPRMLGAIREPPESVQRPVRSPALNST